MPVPVLVGEASTLAGLVLKTPAVATRLAQEFWPGGLTLVVEHAPSLAWDLGDAEGTVAVRLPDDELARDLLRRTGQLEAAADAYQQAIRLCHNAPERAYLERKLSELQG